MKNNLRSVISAALTIMAMLVMPSLSNARHGGGDHELGHGGGQGRFCSAVASKFQQDLRACWTRNSQGCVQYFTRKDVMSDRDFHTCKQELYTTCVKTCYSVWGFNDAACNNSCAIIGKYL